MRSEPTGLYMTEIRKEKVMSTWKPRKWYLRQQKHLAAVASLKMIASTPEEIEIIKQWEKEDFIPCVRKDCGQCDGVPCEEHYEVDDEY